MSILRRAIILASLLATSSCGLVITTPGKPIIPATSSSPNFDPSKIAKLAVIVDAVGRGTSFGRSPPTRLIEDQFLQILLAKGYTIASRSDVQAVLREIKFQQSGFTDGDVARLGRMLNVPAVLVVTLNDLQTRYVPPRDYGNRYVYNYETAAALGARLISVERSEVLWVGSIASSFRVDQGQENDIVRFLARGLANHFPKR